MIPCNVCTPEDAIFKPCLCPWKSYLSLWKHDVLLNIMLSLIMLWMVQKSQWNSVKFLWVWYRYNDHNSMNAQSIFFCNGRCWQNVIFFIKCYEYILWTTLSAIWQNAPTALNFHWTLHTIMRLDIISNHGRGSPQWSITSEISISIIKHVQIIIIITIICIFCVRVATKPITFTSTEDSTY